MTTERITTNGVPPETTRTEGQHMETTTRYEVTYLDWTGKTKTDQLTIHQVIGYDNAPAYAAENLQTLGYGKHGKNHTEAISRLVLDHGTKILNVSPL